MVISKDVELLLCLEMHDWPFNLKLDSENYCCLEMHDWPFNLELELGSIPVRVDRAG